MDEQRVAELFHAAVGETPPATFGSDDVVAASRRAATRRRAGLASGALLGVAVLAGGALAVDQLMPADPGGAGAGQAAAPRGAGAPDAQPFALPSGPAARSVPVGGACGPADGPLTMQVTAVLAERGIAQTGPVAAVSEPCAPGTRSVAVPVPGGVLDVLLVPFAGQPEPVQISRPDGARGYALTLRDGRGLAVISLPRGAGQQAPYSDALPDMARTLAGRL